MKARKGLLVLLAMMLPISACTHRQSLEMSSGPEAYRAANQMTAFRDAEVVARDGRTFRWRDVRFTRDSTVGVPAVASLPTEQIYKVTVKSRWKGALQGAPIGAGVGVVMSVIPGECIYNESWGEVCPGTSKAFWTYTVGGALWGAMIGAIRSSRDQVEVRLSESPTTGISVQPTFGDGIGFEASIPFGQ